MSFINSYNHFHGNDLLSGNPAVYRRQISRIKAYTEKRTFAAKKARSYRNALYRDKLRDSRRGNDATELLKSNPRQLGGPRMFKVLVAGEHALSKNRVRDPDFYEDEGHWLYFPAFGRPGMPVCFNDGWIQPKDVHLTRERNFYTIHTVDSDGASLSLALDFTALKEPTGHLWIADAEYELRLQPYAVQYSVETSADSGAYNATGGQHPGLQWDTASDQWQSATWERNSMVFAYDTVSFTDDFGISITVNEVAYTDKLANDQTLSLEAKDMMWYSAVMGEDESDGSTFMQVSVDAFLVPPPPPARADNVITSVFPERSLFRFDPWLLSLTGAYIVSSSSPEPLVYAVNGTALDLQGTPLRNSFNRGARPQFRSRINPIRDTFAKGRSQDRVDGQLSVQGLLGMNPMTPDPDTPTGYYDSISSQANKDFVDIIAYHMDDDLRTTFIQSSPITLDPTVQAIATDGNNAPFYQTLQVPYVTASLARSTLEEGKQCNGARSQAQLRELPTKSEVYKRHTDKLYRHHFREQFPAIKQYLDDQEEQSPQREEGMENAAAKMKDKIQAAAEGMGDGGDPDTAEQNLQEALADVDSLLEWAMNEHLFWAFNLFKYEIDYDIPKLAAQMVNGNASDTISRRVKSLNGTFSMLEGGKTNSYGNQKTFQQAFNDALRVYMMTTMIPQFVDPNGEAEDFDSILKAMLEEFAYRNSTNLDPNLAEQASNAKFLAQQDEIRHRFIQNLTASVLASGTLGSWGQMVATFNDLNGKSPWYQNLANHAQLASTFMSFASTAMLVMPMLGASGGWGTMSDSDRIQWITNLVDTTITLVIKLAQGAIRLNSLWDDLAGFGSSFKAFLGFPNVLKKLPSAAEKVQGSFAKWLVRTPQEARALTGEAVTTTMKIFGRSAGEFLTNLVGSLLSVVDLVLTALDLANASNPLQIAMDSLMLASTALQLLAIGADWLAGAGVFASEAAIAVLQSAASILGPLSVAFAIAGMIIMLVMMFLPSDPPNPIQDFIDEWANKAGLKMPYRTDIDYFDRIPPDDSAPSLEGISVFQLQYLALGSETGNSASCFDVRTKAEMTYFSDTCWFIATDSEGKSTIYTYALDHEDTWIAVCLESNESGGVDAARPPSKFTTDADGNPVPVDEAEYQKAVARQQWIFTCVSEGQYVERTPLDNGEKETDNEDKETQYLYSARFQITQKGKQLQFQGSGSSLDVVLAPLSSHPPEFTLTVQVMGPGDFQYAIPEWKLTTRSRDEVNRVLLSRPMSEPMTWSITPRLPAFLQLLGSGDEGGNIKQVEASSPQVMAPQKYTVTASLNIGGTKYKSTKDVTISVLDPSVPPSE
ncbi:hypothetical protein BDW75DRAFT_246164 [Aspergillus navahoensis]